MTNIEKKICPRCNYLGRDQDAACPYCGLKLISKCPKCKTSIKVAFAEYCYICGFRFKSVTDELNRKEDMKREEDAISIDSD